GSSPAFGSKRRSSSVVEHVNSQFVSYPSVYMPNLYSAKSQQHPRIIMRPDMHKVVIERPRHGRSWAESRPRPKPPFDESRPFESIMARHTRRKWFSDLLGPLKRWLQSHIGRPWNGVYSE